MIRMIKIGVLISGGGSNLQAVIDACESGKISGEVVFVGSDNPSAKGLKRAENHGIPAFTVDYRTIIRKLKAAPDAFSFPEDFDPERVKVRQFLFLEEKDEERLDFFIRSRVIAEKRLLDHMGRYDFDLLVLAGFMRNLTPFFIDAVNGGAALPRIMNIHPALLPAFPGVDGYGDTYRYGCKIGGCTVHFVDYGEDSGPIIGQRSFPISDRDTLEEIRDRGLSLEWQLYPECIQLYAENRLKVVSREHHPEGTEAIRRNIVQVLPK